MSQTKPARWALLVALAASVGCSRVGSSPCDSYVLGQPSDVKTVPGAYDGYTVINGCTVSPAQLAVRGLGQGTTGGPDVCDLAKAIAKPGTIFGCMGIRSACTTQGGMLDVSDWSAVDAIIEQLGHLLKSSDSSLEVALHVYPPPCE